MAKNISQVFAANPITSVAGTSLIYLGVAGVDGAIQGTNLYNSSTSNAIFNNATLVAITNQLVLGITNTTTISSTAPSASRVYTIPDAGGAANFLMSAGTQTIAGANTFSSALTVNPVSNQLVLGGVSAGHTTTISATAPANNSVYTIPDAGTTANFLMSQGTQTIAGSNTFTSQLNVNNNILQTISTNGANLSFTTESNALSGPTVISHNLLVNNSNSGTQCFILVGHASAQQYVFGWDRSTNNFLISVGGTLNSSNALIINQSGLGTFVNALTISPATNQLVLGGVSAGNTTTISATAPASNAIYTIPDVGTSANFIMSTGTQTISGIKTFSGTPIFSNASSFKMNGGGSTNIIIKINGPVIDNNYTFPDAGRDANILLDQGTKVIAGGTTFSDSVVFSNSLTISPTTNQLILGVTNTTTLNCPAPASSIVLTFPNTAQTMVGRTTTDTMANKTFSNVSYFNTSIINAPLTYSTGTLSLASGGIITGVGTTFTAAMVGGVIVLADGTELFIISFTSTTSLTVQDNTVRTSQNFVIYYGGNQSNLNIANSAGWTGLCNLFVTNSLNYPYTTIATTGATNPTYLNSGQTIGIPVLSGNATATLPAVATSQGMRLRYVVTSGVTALGFTFAISTADTHVLSGNFMLVSVNTTVTFGTHATLTFSATTAKNGDWLEFNCLNGKWLVSGSGFGSASIAVA